MKEKTAKNKGGRKHQNERLEKMRWLKEGRKERQWRIRRWTWRERVGFKRQEKLIDLVGKGILKWIRKSRKRRWAYCSSKIEVDGQNGQRDILEIKTLRLCMAPVRTSSLSQTACVSEWQAFGMKPSRLSRLRAVPDLLVAPSFYNGGRSGGA